MYEVIKESTLHIANILQRQKSQDCQIYNNIHVTFLKVCNNASMFNTIEAHNK
jgi:hypothetical protein